MRRRVPDGFTLAEILVAMTLTLAIFAITLPFVRVQTQALAASAGRLDADQLARYAARAIDHDLRVASATTGQPLLVFAGPRGIAFSANLVARDTSDPGALELEAGAAATLTEAWQASAAAPVAGGARGYPAQDYLDAAGVLSHHETIAFFLHPDTIAARSDDYVLWRRVNARDSVAIVRGIQLPADSAFFSYHRVIADTLARIAASRLPLYWDSAAIDSIRVVGVRANGLSRNRNTGLYTIRTVYWETTITNATTRLASQGCGAAPAQPAANQFDARVRSTAPLGYRVDLDWRASTDDGGGEGDVVAYALDRRVSGGSTWEYVGSVPAKRTSTYLWYQAAPSGVGDYDYGLRAVDRCGQGSSRAIEAGVTLP